MVSAGGHDSSQEVKACNICGDIGFSNCLALCCRCNDGVEHIYCVQTMIDITPSDWVCEECKLRELRTSAITRCVGSLVNDHNLKLSDGATSTGSSVNHHISKLSDGLITCYEGGMNGILGDQCCAHNNHLDAKPSYVVGTGVKVVNGCDPSSTQDGQHVSKLSNGSEKCVESVPDNIAGGERSPLQKTLSKGHTAGQHVLPKIPRELKVKQVSFLLSSRPKSIVRSARRTQHLPQQLSAVVGKQEGPFKKIKTLEIANYVLNRAQKRKQEVRQWIDKSTPPDHHISKQHCKVSSIKAGQQDQSQKSQGRQTQKKVNEEFQRGLLGRAPVTILPSFKANHVFKEQMTCQLMRNMHNREDLAWPDHYYLWSGCFSVLSCSGGYRCYRGIQAHRSSMADPKVGFATQAFPFQLQLEEQYRGVELDTWPVSFQDTPPTNRSIGIFFFPTDQRSSDTWYMPLLCRLTTYDLVLLAKVSCAELLIYPSLLLPQGEQYWDERPYLWGVFRANKSKTSQSTADWPVPEVTLPRVGKESWHNTSDVHKCKMDIDTIGVQEISGGVMNGLAESRTMQSMVSCLTPLTPELMVSYAGEECRCDTSDNHVLDMDIDMIGGREVSMIMMNSFQEETSTYSDSACPPLPQGSPPTQPSPPPTPPLSQHDDFYFSKTTKATSEPPTDSGISSVIVDHNAEGRKTSDGLLLGDSDGNESSKLAPQDISEITSDFSNSTKCYK